AADPGVLQAPRELGPAVAVLPGQGAVAGFRGRLLGPVHGDPRAQAEERAARPGDPAAEDAGAAGPERPVVLAPARASRAVRAVAQEGHPAVRTARERQDAHDSLSGRGPGGPHDLPDHG